MEEGGLVCSFFSDATFPLLSFFFLSFYELASVVSSLEEYCEVDGAGRVLIWSLGFSGLVSLQHFLVAGA